MSLTPPRPGSNNAKHAATFFLLSLAVLVLPLLLPSHPAPRATPTPIYEATPVPDLVQPVGGLGRSVMAKKEAEETPINWNENENGGLGFELREKMQSIIFSLLMISALIFLTLKLVQKYWPGVLKPRTSEVSLMKVLAQQTIVPGVHLSLVQVCNKNVLIGFTEHNVSVLCEIAEEEMEKAREAHGQVLAQAPEVPIKTPAEVYREILYRYLSIIPGFGGKR